MKQTKQNTIKLLKKMVASKMSLVKIFKTSGDEESARDYLQYIHAFNEVIALLSDEKYFDTIAQIYGE